jgi:hypothetical protein
MAMHPQVARFCTGIVPNSEASDCDALCINEPKVLLGVKHPQNHVERVQAEMNAAMEALAASHSAERAGANSPQLAWQDLVGVR